MDNMLQGARPDNYDAGEDHDIKVYGYRDGGKLQAMLTYTWDKADPHNPDDREMGLSRGVWMGLQTLAVAPWHHPKSPNRKKGYGTKMFMYAVKRMLAKANAKGLILESLNEESDKFYDALGLEMKVLRGRQMNWYKLERADAQELYDAYKAKLRKGGGSGRLDF